MPFFKKCIGANINNCQMNDVSGDQYNSFIDSTPSPNLVDNNGSEQTNSTRRQTNVVAGPQYNGTVQVNRSHNNVPGTFNLGQNAGQFDVDQNTGLFNLGLNYGHFKLRTNGTHPIAFDQSRLSSKRPQIPRLHTIECQSDGSNDHKPSKSPGSTGPDTQETVHRWERQLLAGATPEIYRGLIASVWLKQTYHWLVQVPILSKWYIVCLVVFDFLSVSYLMYRQPISSGT